MWGFWRCWVPQLNFSVHRYFSNEYCIAQITKSEKFKLTYKKSANILHCNVACIIENNKIDFYKKKNK